jgi:hypothetical protein
MFLTVPQLFLSRSCARLNNDFPMHRHAQAHLAYRLGSIPSVATVAIIFAEQG